LFLTRNHIFKLIYFNIQIFFTLGIHKMTQEKTLIENLRSQRVNIAGVDMAVFDLAGTFVISYYISKEMGWNPYVTVGLSLPAGYLIHKAVGVETPLNKKIDEVRVAL
jgi:hypothetical protein